MQNSRSLESPASQTLQYGNFQFTAVGLDRIGTDMVTEVLIVVDVSYSVRTFKDELEKCIDAIIAGCKKSPNHEQLHIRVLAFSDDVEEVTGFIPIGDHQSFAGRLEIKNATALIKATLDGLSSIQGYAETLKKADYMSNAVLVVITDGEDNASGGHRAREISDLVRDKMLGHDVGDEKTAALIREGKIPREPGWILQHLQTILVAVNAKSCIHSLREFSDEAKFGRFVDLGDVTPGKLAKLADFVSKSVSSSSTALPGQAPAPVAAPSFGI